jgi:hypothetical protein
MNNLLSIFLVKSHAKLVLALVLAVLVGRRTAPKREEQSRDIQITLRTAESSPSGSTQSDDDCGLDDFPVSKLTDEILAAVSRDIAGPRNRLRSLAVSASLMDFRNASLSDLSGLQRPSAFEWETGCCSSIWQMIRSSSPLRNG